MSKLLRFYSAGNVYFVTSVTRDRQPILRDYPDLLRASLDKYQRQYDFELVVWVFLPDHWHLIIDPMNHNLSTIMQNIKLSISKKIRFKLGSRSGSIWQGRFWDHIIRNSEDFRRHVDYIHYIPVKHGLAAAPSEWRYSLFGDYLIHDYYEDDWGVHERVEISGDFGE